MPGSSSACCCPAPHPTIAETLRLVPGWAWTYVIVAELIGSSSGIGHMITDSQALLNTGQIIFGIIVIGVIGLISDFAFKAAPEDVPWACCVERCCGGPADVHWSSGRTRDHSSASRRLPRLPGPCAARDHRSASRRSIDSPSCATTSSHPRPSGCGKSTLLRIVAGLDTPKRPDACCSTVVPIRRPRPRSRDGVPELHAVSRG
jgi:hypothetical protein